MHVCLVAIWAVSILNARTLTIAYTKVSATAAFWMNSSSLKPFFQKKYTFDNGTLRSYAQAVDKVYLYFHQTLSVN